MDASVLNPMMFFRLISFASWALNHKLLFFEITMISSHMLSSIPSWPCLCPFFNSFPQSSVVLLPSSSLTFSHCLRSFIWLIFSRSSMPSLFSCRLSQPNHSLCFSTVLLFFHFPFRLHQVFLLEYLAFSVVKHNFSKSHLDSPFENFCFPSVCFRSLLRVSFYRLLNSRW